MFLDHGGSSSMITHSLTHSIIFAFWRKYCYEVLEKVLWDIRSFPVIASRYMSSVYVVLPVFFLWMRSWGSVNFDSTWRVSLESKEFVHWMCGCATLSARSRWGSWSWKTYLWHSRGHNLYVCVDPCSDDSYVGDDPTSQEKGDLFASLVTFHSREIYFVFKSNWVLVIPFGLTKIS